MDAVKSTKVLPKDVNPILIQLNESEIPEPTSALSVLRRPNVDINDVVSLLDGIEGGVYSEHPGVVHGVNTAIKYEGYIEKLHRDVERFAVQEKLAIPTSFAYSNVKSLSTEGREKLERIRPGSLGQASRIPGVSASDISILSLYLR